MGIVIQVILIILEPNHLLHWKQISVKTCKENFTFEGVLLEYFLDGSNVLLDKFLQGNVLLRNLLKEETLFLHHRSKWLRPWSGGVNSTLSPVNSISKFLVSVSFETRGVNGGVISFRSNASQSIVLKNSWFWILSKYNRLFGSLSIYF